MKFSAPATFYRKFSGDVACVRQAGPGFRAGPGDSFERPFACHAPGRGSEDLLGAALMPVRMLGAAGPDVLDDPCSSPMLISPIAEALVENFCEIGG